jgi:hypothetical protein
VIHRQFWRQFDLLGKSCRPPAVQLLGERSRRFPMNLNCLSIFSSTAGELKIKKRVSREFTEISQHKKVVDTLRAAKV